jgi:hypothetical protein
VALSARIPVTGWVNGVVGLAAEVEHQEYGNDGGVLVSRRRSARASFEQWALPNLRWDVSAGVERWLDAGTFATAGAGVEQRAFDDRVALGLNAQFWPGNGGFSSLSTGMRWRSSNDAVNNLLLVEANGALVSDGAPEDLWHGAGTGVGTACCCAHIDCSMTASFGPRPLAGRLCRHRPSGGTPCLRFGGCNR